MPNTLAHLGVQTILGRAAQPTSDIKWILAGCVIPDLSWILQTLLRRTDISLVDLRLYAIVQTTLLFCLILAGALAILSRTPRKTFVTLTLACVLHLLLDATQTKWGNGVLFFAPFDWTLFNFALYWPEDWPSYALTLFGLAALIVLWTREGPAPITVRIPNMSHLLPAIALFVLWIAGPFYLTPQAEAVNLHNTAVLRDASQRTGQNFAVDRNAVNPKSGALQSWADEVIFIDGPIPQEAETISLKGKFTAPDRLTVTDLYIHTPGPRTWFSYAGLLAVLAWWGHGLWRGIRRAP